MAQVSLTDATICINLSKWVVVQHCDIVRYVFVIVIFYCANTTALYLPDWKYSKGVVRYWVEKCAATCKRLKTTGLRYHQSQLSLFPSSYTPQCQITQSVLTDCGSEVWKNKFLLAGNRYCHRQHCLQNNSKIWKGAFMAIFNYECWAARLDAGVLQSRISSHNCLPL